MEIEDITKRLIEISKITDYAEASIELNYVIDDLKEISQSLWDKSDYGLTAQVIRACRSCDS